jgi:hypothetical protein
LQAGQQLVQIRLPTLRRRVQHLEEAVRVQAEVGGGRARLGQEMLSEDVAVEDAGILGKQTEEDADQEAFERVPAATARLQGISSTHHPTTALRPLPALHPLAARAILTFRRRSGSRTLGFG